MSISGINRVNIPFIGPFAWGSPEAFSHKESDINSSANPQLIAPGQEQIVPPQVGAAVAPTVQVASPDSKENNEPSVETSSVDIVPPQVEAAVAPTVQVASPDSKENNEPSVETSSVDTVILASPSVRAQCQQSEAVKAAVSPSAGTIDASIPPPVQEQGEPLSSSSSGIAVPAAAVHREVPAVQEVLRAKIDSAVSLYPELAASQAGIVSLIAGSIDEATASQIQRQYTLLLEVLLPSLSIQMQGAYVSQLETLHEEIRRILDGKDWARDCLTAASVLLSSLEHLTHGAFEEISDELGTKGVPVSKSFTYAVEKNPSVEGKYPGWSKRHKNQKK